MSTTVRRVDYFHASVQDRPGEAYRFLAQLKELGVNLLAFTAVPVGPDQTQLTLFPDDSGRLVREAGAAGLPLTGPHPALLAQGDDHLGVLAEIHEALFEAGVNVYASSAVTDGKGDFGYLLYLRPDAVDRAARALGL